MCNRPAATAVDGVGGGAVGVLVAVPTADPLVAAAAERPSPVLRRRAVAGEQHAPHIDRLAGVLEGGEQLVDGVRTEGVADLGAIERDPHGAVLDGAVVRDVRELESLDLSPGGRIEQLRDAIAFGAHDHSLPDGGPGPRTPRRQAGQARRPTKPRNSVCTSDPGATSTFGPNTPGWRSIASIGLSPEYAPSTMSVGQRLVPADGAREIPRVHEQIGGDEPAEQLLRRHRTERAVDRHRQVSRVELRHERLLRPGPGVRRVLVGAHRRVGGAAEGAADAEEAVRHVLDDVARLPVLARRLVVPGARRRGGHAGVEPVDEDLHPVSCFAHDAAP